MRGLFLGLCLLAIPACGTNLLRNESSVVRPSPTNTPIRVNAHHGGRDAVHHVGGVLRSAR
ncbi:MAG TPA: hypothetical protein VFH46_12655 [Pyrinomonadaceae bacterium]|nr:hypothetical protein [Pyrinomonadaceae bacterium]